jgi:Cell division protein CrgA
MGLPSFNRRSSNQSQGSIPGGSSVGLSAGSAYVGDSSSSDWPDDASEKESLRSWAKEQQEKEAQDEDDQFAAKEEQHLRRWFIFIAFGMMIVGIVVSVITYYYLHGEEIENFEVGVSK